ncbi:protein of unknown function [Paraburkholderia dioscoreae]|uniref:Uncharacterized protein n=1 Tax=Paraburkholderia dioscoreae TaxID=2604047 RepID=A0A5Q4ZHF4_9BURK|nr:protein of unknown function [Paraburkholderia dioscoreae]
MVLVFSVAIAITGMAGSTTYAAFAGPRFYPRILNVLCRGKSDDLSHLRSAANPLLAVQAVTGTAKSPAVIRHVNFR